MGRPRPILISPHMSHIEGLCLPWKRFRLFSEFRYSKSLEPSACEEPVNFVVPYIAIGF